MKKGGLFLNLSCMGDFQTHISNCSERGKTKFVIVIPRGIRNKKKWKKGQEFSGIVYLF